MKYSKIKDAIQVLREAKKADARISLSGGIDSTLIHWLNIRFNTGIDKCFTSIGVENKHNVKMLKKILKHYSDVEIAKPKSTYKEIVNDLGFPLGNKKFSDSAFKIRTHAKKLKVEKGTYKTTMYNMCSISYDALGKENFSIEKNISRINNSPRVRMYKLIKDVPIQQRCCDILKKQPASQSGDKAIIGILSDDSSQRREMIKRTWSDGYNGNFLALRLWTKKDVIDFCYKYKVDISLSYLTRKVNGVTIKGSTGTGCPMCHFGNTVGHSIIVDGKEVKTTKLEIFKIEFPGVYEKGMAMECEGYTFAESVKMYEDSQKFKYFKESLEFFNERRKAVCEHLDEVRKKNFNEICEYLIEKDTGIMIRRFENQTIEIDI